MRPNKQIDTDNKEWIVYGLNEGLHTFDTEDEALKFADSLLDIYRDEASDGWDEEVETIFVAKILYTVNKTDEHPPGEGEPQRFDYICDYALKKIKD